MEGGLAHLAGGGFNDHALSLALRVKISVPTVLLRLVLRVNVQDLK